jgi:putative tryptophan/tyrosine transport system substrate-binding protein
MRRREFITWLGGATVFSFAASAQHAPLRSIGFLHAGSPEPNADFVSEFRKGLGETAQIEGRDFSIEFRWAEGRDDRLPELAADLIDRKVAVIAAPGSTQAALAAKAATSTIPIVFTVAVDPVVLGLVSSFNRPNGNATGIFFISPNLAAKRLGLMKELLPHTATFIALVTRHGPLTKTSVQDLEAGAAQLSLQVETLQVDTITEIDAAVAKVAERNAALLVSPDALFTDRRAQLVTLATRHAVPAIYPLREYTEIGGLMSYGPRFAGAYHQAGVYAGRILSGEKPADLPVQQSTKFEFIINLKTVKLLGLAMPPTLLALADEVIE